MVIFFSETRCRYHYDLRKYSCTAGTVNIWNSLPESIISAVTTDAFKNRLDMFWNNQDVLFDYKADSTGVGKRSLNVNLSYL